MISCRKSPVPVPEEHEHENYPDTHKRCVGTYLHLAEFAFQRLRNRQRQTLTGKYQGVAAHLARDSERKDSPACKEFEEPERVPGQRIHVKRHLQEAGEPHCQVGVETEQERHGYLEELPLLEVPAQEQNLYRYEKHVHAYRQLPH